MAVWAKNHKARTIWFSRGRGLNFTSSWKFFSLASRARLFFSLIYFFPLHTMEQKFYGSSFFFKCKKLKSDYFFNQCAGQNFFFIKIRARIFFWKISIRYFICSFFISINTLSYWLKMQIFYTVTGKSYFLL